MSAFSDEEHLRMCGWIVDVGTKTARHPTAHVVCGYAEAIEHERAMRQAHQAAAAAAPAKRANAARENNDALYALYCAAHSKALLGLAVDLPPEATAAGHVAAALAVEHARAGVDRVAITTAERRDGAQLVVCVAGGMLTEASLRALEAATAQAVGDRPGAVLLEAAAPPLDPLPAGESTYAPGALRSKRDVLARVAFLLAAPDEDGGDDTTPPSAAPNERTAP